jgi:hypothetical protein
MVSPILDTIGDALRRRFMIRPHGATTLGDAVRILPEALADSATLRAVIGTISEGLERP